MHFQFFDAVESLGPNNIGVGIKFPLAACLEQDGLLRGRTGQTENLLLDWLKMFPKKGEPDYLTSPIKST